MNPYHGRALTRPEEPLTPVILRDDAWTARRIRNNCLRQHCHVLATTFRRSEFVSLRAICARVFLVLETRSHVVTEIHPTELAVVAGVARLGFYSTQWLRQPEDWQPDANADGRSQWADLLRHLLARYPVPLFLDAAWEIHGTLEHFDRDCWCALAQGRSLRDVAGFPRCVPHRVLHGALTSDKSRSCRTLAEAIWLAHLRALNSSSMLEAAVLSSRIPYENGNHAWWLRLAAKFSANSDELAAQFGFVANSLAAVRAHRGSAQVDQLLKLALPTLIRHCHRFVAGLLKANGHVLTDVQIREAAAKADLSKLAKTRWQPLLGAVPFASRRGQTRAQPRWLVEELCSIKALQDEGRVMRHCLAGYVDRCRAGRAAIFSVRHYQVDDDGNTQVTSYATIEVQPSTRTVVQIRAYRNHPVNNTIMTMIQEWANAKELVCTR
jgi:hypothetical protein